MSMPVLKTESTIALPAAPLAEVVRLRTPKAGFIKAKLLPTLGSVAAQVVPSLVMICLLLVVWQVLCSRPGATLPSPTKIWSEARDLIVDPFFVAGPQDIGLGWRVLT